MRIRILVPLVALAGAVAASAECREDLGVTRLFPWPEVPREMISSLARLAAEEAFTSKAEPLKEALVRADQPDQVVAHLFKPVPLADVRRYYGPGNLTPDGHALLRDPKGLRALLAKTLVDVSDPVLQTLWMAYLGEDPSPAVRTNAAITALRWSDSSLREAFFAKKLGVSHADAAVARAALALPERISPALRFYAVDLLIRLQRDDFEPDILRALDTYPERNVLRSWFSDQVAGRRIASGLTQSRNSWIDDDARRAGLFLSDLRNSEARRRWKDALGSLATKTDSQGGFARSALTWSRFGEQINTFVDALFVGEPIEHVLARVLVAIKEIPGREPEHLDFTREALTHRTMLFLRGDLRPLPVDWADADITQFRKKITASEANLTN